MRKKKNEEERNRRRRREKGEGVTAIQCESVLLFFIPSSADAYVGTDSEAERAVTTVSPQLRSKSLISSDAALLRYL